MSEETHTLSITQDQQGRRLDRLLADEVQALSRSRIKALIESGCVSIDEKTIEDPNFRVKLGSVIRLRVPPPVSDVPVPQSIPLNVVFEDEHVIVIDKPAGLVVHPAAGNPDRTLVNALLSHCGDSLKGIGGVKRPGIVHRLDKDTSGLLVAAKTDVAHSGLTKQFSEHAIERCYSALTWGVPSPLNGTVSGAIGRSSRNRKKMAVVERGGKEAITHYRVIEALGLTASLVECRLETGRTHQIRVHMAHKGHGVVGDPLYGRGVRRGVDDTVKAALKSFGRQALHARLLGFEHPVTKEVLKFETEVPTDFAALLDSFRAAE